MAGQLEELYQNQNLSKNQTVTERYGKLATLLEPKSNLSRAIHREGARALKDFGYQPRRRFIGTPPATGIINTITWLALMNIFLFKDKTYNYFPGCCL